MLEIIKLAEDKYIVSHKSGFCISPHTLKRYTTYSDIHEYCVMNKEMAGYVLKLVSMQRFSE